jgi:hypothetical protein
MKDGARFVLAFGPRDDEWVVANFPTTIYRFYTGNEVRRLLEEAGFAGVSIMGGQISSRAIVFCIAHRGTIPDCLSSRRSFL